jgi:hypothetical protein
MVMPERFSSSSRSVSMPERLDQCGLAVVDVSGGADDH